VGGSTTWATFTFRRGAKGVPIIVWPTQAGTICRDILRKLKERHPEWMDSDGYDVRIDELDDLGALLCGMATDEEIDRIQDAARLGLREVPALVLIREAQIVVGTPHV
jgi:hypothetical protein